MNADKKTKQVIMDITRRIEREYKPEKIILYGSYAYGKPDRDSDIDLLIVKDTNGRPIDRRVEIRKIASDIRMGYPFSPFVLTPNEVIHCLDVGDQFLQEIINRGEVLYET